MENRDRGRFYDSGAEFNHLVERLHSRGIKVLAAAASVAAEDILKGSTGIQDAMETPVSTVNWDVVSFMMYTSMFAGYLKPFVNQRDAEMVSLLGHERHEKYDVETCRSLDRVHRRRKARRRTVLCYAGRTSARYCGQRRQRS